MHHFPLPISFHPTSALSPPTMSALPITRAEYHKRAQLKVEEGVRLSLEARRRAEEEEDHTRIESEEEARLVEEARLKYGEEEEDYARIEAEEEARLVGETRLKSE